MLEEIEQELGLASACAEVNVGDPDGAVAEQTAAPVIEPVG
jgi:hypothetical protein